MKEIDRVLLENYAAALEYYLFGGGAEAALQHAYDLGRRAISEGLGVLGLASVHEQCVSQILQRLPASEDRAQLVERGMAFFSESISPFEMVLRGYKETNEKLGLSLHRLQETQEELYAQNEGLAAAHEAAEAERQRYRELFEFAPDGYLVTDLDGTIQEANSASATLLKLPAGQLVGQPLLRFVSDEERVSFTSQIERFRRGELSRLQDWQLMLRPSDGGAVPAALAVDAEGDSRTRRVVGLRWLLRDVSDRVRAEEERSQLVAREQVARAEAAASSRFGFLADAGSLLVASLDYESTLSQITRLAVPLLADWCFLHVADPNGPIRLLEIACADRARTESADSLRLGERLGVLALQGLEKAELIEEVTEDWLWYFAETPEQWRILQGLMFRAAMMIPLVAHERKFGAITLVSAESGRRYSKADLALAEELARRCALAVENALLYRDVILERDKAESASRAKDEFFAILGHELRNPLTPVIGWARLLKSQGTIQQDPVLAEGVLALERNAQHIARLVDDCLDLARISEGKIQLNRQTVDLNQIVATAVMAVRATARSRELKLVAQTSESSLWLCADASRLQQVLLNLLGNAVKFTAPGGMVSVRTVTLDSEAEVEVRDTGIGIASEYLEQIFVPFRQGTTSWLTSESGLGLGLAISRQIVEMHGGRIWADSDGVGRGSVFRVRLPISAPVAPEQRQELPPAACPPRERPLRLLIVEDSRDVALLLKLDLERLGYTVVTASDGVSGLTLAGRELPDLIISDIKMPGIDGLELIRRVRSVPELAAIPAIALTGFGMKKDIERALAAGYNACLSKPSDPAELNEVIRGLTGEQAGERQA